VRKEIGRTHLLHELWIDNSSALVYKRFSLNKACRHLCGCRHGCRCTKRDRKQNATHRFGKD
jgi:hypothetical protein